MTKANVKIISAFLKIIKEHFVGIINFLGMVNFRVKSY